MTDQTSVSVHTFSETDTIHFALAHASAQGLPLALWRLPNQARRQLLLSSSVAAITNEDAIEELAPGFLFAPFDRDKKRQFLKADFLFSFENRRLIVSDNPIESKSYAWLSEVFQRGNLTTVTHAGHLPNRIATPDNYHSIVEAAVSKIKTGALEKVVLSRRKMISLPEGFDLVTVFNRLCETYPHALVSYVTIPGIGSWLGASPETLVTVDDNRIFRTIALAGTLPYLPGTDLKTIAWTQKEIEEQALVERYIISCFKKIRLREYEEQGPKTVVAGNLVHLRSDFSVDLKATNFPQLGSVMLKLLHPTSAVCGSPIEEASMFIKQNEQYDREFYAGYLGPVNINRSVDIFVNLRCMKINGSTATLFAGAGITEDSVAEKEYLETEMKFNTLLNVIGQ